MNKRWILMAFILTSAVTINGYTLNKVKELRTKRSVLSYIDEAIIQLPATGRVIERGKVISEQTDTAKFFSVGDPVTIATGYNGDNNVEFTGFVRRINYAIPVVVECEGYGWLLRKKTYQKTFAKTGLRDLLEYLVKDIPEIRVDDNVVNTNLGKVILANKDTGGPIVGTKVMDWLHDAMKQSIYFRNFNQLYAGLQMLPRDVKYAPQPANVKYDIGWNTRRDNGLRCHSASDTLIKVIVISGDKDGSHLRAEAGDNGGDIITINLPAGLDQKYVNELCKDALAQQKYDGYEGRLNAFLQPYCQPGDVALITDQRFPKRNGDFYIETVETIFSISGARRTVGISQRID